MGAMGEHRGFLLNFDNHLSEDFQAFYCSQLNQLKGKSAESWSLSEEVHIKFPPPVNAANSPGSLSRQNIACLNSTVKYKDGLDTPHTACMYLPSQGAQEVMFLTESALTLTLLMLHWWARTWFVCKLSTK